MQQLTQQPTANRNSSSRYLMVTALLLLSLSATGCASSEQQAEPSRLPTDAEVEQYNASVPPEKRIVCREERQVVSNIPKRVCRYISDLQETGVFHRAELRRVLR